MERRGEEGGVGLQKRGFTVSNGIASMVLGVCFLTNCMLSIADSLLHDSNVAVPLDSTRLIPNDGNYESSMKFEKSSGWQSPGTRSGGNPVGDVLLQCLSTLLGQSS